MQGWEASCAGQKPLLRLLDKPDRDVRTPSCCDLSSLEEQGPGFNTPWRMEVMEVSRGEATHCSLATHKPGTYIVLQGLQGKDTGAFRVFWTPRARAPLFSRGLDQTGLG